MCLQETDINEFSRVNDCHNWKAKGYHAALGPLSQDKQMVRVAIISRSPIQSITLSEVSHPDRVAAAIVEFRNHQAGIRKLLVCSYYGPAADEPFAAALASEIARAATMLRFPWMILGVFHVQQQDSYLADLLLSGNVYAMDECFGPLNALPPTRNKSTRRIDFGLSSKHLYPFKLTHVEGVADHLAVIYAFHSLFSFTCWSGPQRQQICSDQLTVDLDRQFETIWNEDLFLSTLQNQGTNEAYCLLSKAAEQTLAGLQPAKKKACPRAQPWQPTVKLSQHQAAKQTESVLLHRLRRLHRRFQQALQRPLDELLVQKCYQGIQQLKPQAQEFNRFSPKFSRIYVMLPKAVRLRLEQEEKQACIKVWQGQTHGSLAKQSAWIKRRSHSLAELESVPPDHTHSFTAIHPAHVVAEQQNIWESKWTQKNPVSSCSFDSIFQSVDAYRPSQWQGDIPWNGNLLKKIAAEMVNKVMGPDDWAKDLLRLPLKFWNAVAHLWHQVYLTGNIPISWYYARIALLPKGDSEWRRLSIASVFWRIGTRHVIRCLRPWIQTAVSPPSLVVSGLVLKANNSQMMIHKTFACVAKSFHPESRAHLVWVCPATEGYRRGIPPPEDRVAERMFAKCTPSFPGPHITICPDGQVRELAAELCQVQPSVQSVFIAIDGSSKHHVGAWAISAQHRLSDFASCLTSED